MRLIGGYLVALLVVGCGGSSSAPDNGEPLSAEATAAACEESCTHMVECSWTTDGAACESGCAAQAPLFRGSGLRAWLDCILAAECTGGHPGEACYIETAMEIEARAVHDEYVAECQGLATTCPGTTLPSGVCDVVQVIMFSDTYMTNTVLPCFQLPCDQVVACVEETVLDAF